MSRGGADNRRQAKMPSASKARAPNHHGHSEVDLSDARETDLAVPGGHVIKDAGLAKILGKPDRQCGEDTVLLRSEKPCKSRGVETPVTLLLSKDPQYCRSEKAEQAL